MASPPSGVTLDDLRDADAAMLEYHKKFMREALFLAEKALGEDETPVGCVFVHEGIVIAGGANETNASMNGTRHAEFVALEKILAKHPTSILAQSDLYVTVEPCIMCASALRQYGIRAVYYGCANDKFGGTGGVLNIHMDRSVDPQYPVRGGIYTAEAIMLLRRFYVQQNEKAPEPHKKANRVLKQYGEGSVDKNSAEKESTEKDSAVEESAEESQEP